MSAILIETQLLPSLEYFCALDGFDEVIIEKHEHFNKQSFRNRCYLLTSHGVERLSIPLTAKHGKVTITDVRIDYRLRWQFQWWRAIESAYAKAPFYEHYSDALRREIFFGHTHLYDLNLRLLSLCLQWLKWGTALSESVKYEVTPPSTVIDLRSLISAKSDFSGREYYNPQPYQQVFGSNFAANLSLLDLVFCEGPHAAATIRASRKKN